MQAFTLLTQLRMDVDLHVVLMNPGELSKRCQSLGIATTVLDETKMPASHILFALRNRLKALEPDIVHTHRQKENILGSIANLTTCRAKCLRTVHGAPEFAPTGKQKIQVILDKLCARYLQHAIIAVSSELRIKLEAVFPPRKLFVIHNGIDPTEVRASVENTPDFRRRSPDAVHVGIVGRLDPVKRLDLFLKMAAILVADKPKIPWSFHVFGEGQQRVFMESLARELDIENVVTFHGHRSDIRSCIAGLNAVVMPSDHEGLPMTALEALALGVNVIAHATGGLTELLGNDRTLLVTEQNARAYAKALCETIQSNKASKPLDKRYLASYNSQETLSLYRHLCCNHGHREDQVQKSI